MRLLVALARRLPRPLQDVLRRVWFSLAPVGFSRLAWAVKFRTLRAYGISFRDEPASAAKYLLVDPELDNFTYDIANEDELVDFVAECLGAEHDEIERYIEETHADPELNEHVSQRLRRRWDRKRKPYFGRRLGWYAIARTLKPSVIVETGIHDGLGSVLLLRALERNADEGHAGTLVSLDVNPRAGWLVSEGLARRWRPIYESTFDALEAAVRGLEVGMVVHDSDHTYECEHFELTTAVANAAPTLALVSDNAHATTALRDLCASLGIGYSFFRERPERHFYPGAGIGLGILKHDAVEGRADQVEADRSSR